MTNIKDIDWDDEFSQIPDEAPVKFNSGEHADIPSECIITTDKGERFSGKYEGYRLHTYDKDGKYVPSSKPWNYIGIWNPGKEWVDYQDPSQPGQRIGLTFSQVLALAGDFFCGKPVQHCIGRGKTFDDQKERFKRAIKDVTEDPGGIAPNMRKYLSDEIPGIEAALADIPKPGDEAYKHWQKLDANDPEKKGPQNIVQNYVNETAGVATALATSNMMGPIYADILIYNMDHFGKDAWAVYRAGHTLALEIARQGTPESLKLAYLHDAFALHFLTDQFASGHIRTPRVEFNVPSGYLTALQMMNFISEMIAPKSLQMAAGVWDRGTNYMHDTDGAIGLRVSNKNGESWITYGDKQFFAEPNRINRLKSIECAQKSIDEVYTTWRDKKYPEKIRLADGGLEKGGNTDNFAALWVAPLPMTTFIGDNHDATGNASCFWVVERNTALPDIRDSAVFQQMPKTPTDSEKEALKKKTEEDEKKAKEEAAKLPAKSETDNYPTWTPVIGQNYGIDSGNDRISDTRTHTQNGYFFARRSDVELCSLNQFKWGNPGHADHRTMASWDASYVSKSDLRSNDLTPTSVRPVEIYSGGFIQPQEYCKKDGTVNYAVNVWGPVEVPIRFLNTTDMATRKGKAWTQDELDKAARQYTFTLRGRRTQLNSNWEPANNSKNYRWLSWAEVGKSGKTSLLKITHSYKKSDGEKQSAIAAEGWCMNDPFPKTAYQYTRYESLGLAPEGLVFGNASDKVLSKSDFNKMELISGLQDDYFEQYAHMTRFFLFPFKQGSGPSKPDIVALTWTGDDQAVISITSTGNQLTNAILTNSPLTIKSAPTNLVKDIGGSTVSILSGFVKRFEDVDNKPMILHARAVCNGNRPGFTVLPQIYYQAVGGDNIEAKAETLQMTTDVPIKEGDNYQVLVGDTRHSGHREMVVMVGAFPNYYLQAYELKGLKWEESSPTSKGPIAQAKDWMTQSKLTSWKNDWCEHRVTALIPNEPVKNGLNVLLVSYYSYENKLNFRTYIKQGVPLPEDLKPTNIQQPAGNSQPTQAVPLPIGGTTASLPPNQPPGPQWQWVIVSWNEKTTSIVPSWVFIPPDFSSLSSLSPPTVPDQSSLGGFGDNSNLSNFSKTPVPGPPRRNTPFGVYWDMAMVTCPNVKPGALVAAPQAWYGRDDSKIPRQNYGRFEALPLDYSNMLTTTLKGDRWKGYLGYEPDGTETHIKTSNTPPGGLGRLVDVNPDWRNDGYLKTRYGFDAVTKKPIAVMSRSVGDREVRILNPEYLFEQDARDVSVPAPPQAPNPVTTIPSKPTPVTTVPLAAAPALREKTGWSGYVDCVVPDELSGNKHYKDMGWRMVKLGSIVHKATQYGIMNVFSFHGMLGVRVWAPAEPGRWNQWISRGCTPYLGQTSLGTGWDSSGHWNDNASQLSWGMCEDFPDFNLWHGTIDKSSWSVVKGTGWAIPIKQAARPYARGYESKKPEWPHEVNKSAVGTGGTSK